MATILLSAAGAAIGGLSSGTFLGLTGAVIGRAAAPRWAGSSTSGCWARAPTWSNRAGSTVSA